MISKGIRIAREFIPKAKSSLKANRYPTQQALADDALLALCTVSKFLNGKRILFANFVELCTLLNLNWREIAEFDLPDSEAIDQNSSPNTSEFQEPTSRHDSKPYSSPKLVPISVPTLNISIVVLYSSGNPTDEGCA